MSALLRTVVASGEVFPAGTPRSGRAAEVVGDGSWWSGPAVGASAPSVSEPPRTGRGSGLAAWSAYAASLGVEVPEGASRDDVIAAVEGR